MNSYARTPPLVWKMGWVPSPSGEMRTTLPPLPLDFLQEKDVLQEFIFRVNTLGESTTYCVLIDEYQASANVCVCVGGGGGGVAVHIDVCSCL